MSTLSRGVHPLALLAFFVCGAVFADPVTASGAPFAASAYTISDSPLSCDRVQSGAEELLASTTVHPIWQVDPATVEQGSLDDKNIALSGLTALESDLPPTVAALADAPTDDFGLRLDNGWLVGFAYDTIDSKLKTGAYLAGDPIGSEYAGPLLIASVKFH